MSDIGVEQCVFIGWDGTEAAVPACPVGAGLLPR
jgi:hypothetical protein